MTTQPYQYNNTPTTAPIPVATEIKPLAPPKYNPSLIPATGTLVVENKPLNEKQIQRLQQQGFTRSLAQSLEDVKKNFALRIWIVDNSGSMQAADGHRIVEQSSSNSISMVACTRWAEIRSCVEYHIRLASLIEAPTRFRFLNTPRTTGAVGELSIAEGKESDSYLEAERAIERLRLVQPDGVTPLTRHIHEIREQVLEMAPALQATGQRVAIIIATDGLPTDVRGHGDEHHRRTFVEALRTLEGLPVWVVIRLCTDEDHVVNFYNDLDQILELSVDVLDDFTAEAEEIHEFNPWLNYALPLHRVREMGYPDRLFDLIDERAFTKSEVRDYCARVFGNGNLDGAPDPVCDWKGFLSHVSRLSEAEPKSWNPLQCRPKKWVSTNTLRRSRLI